MPKGVHVTDEQVARVLALKAEGKTVREIAHETGMCLRSVYRHLADMDETITNPGFGQAARKMIEAEERRADRKMSESAIEERKHEQFTRRMLDMGYRLDGTRAAKPRTMSAGESDTAGETIPAEDLFEMICGSAPVNVSESDEIPEAVCAGKQPRGDSAEDRRHSEFTMNVMVFGAGVNLSAAKAREMGEKLTRIADTMDELQRLTAGLEA